MPATLPNLPNLAGTNVTPNVPAHTLTDADITVVNHAATVGIGADRKVTLGELKAHIVTPEVTALDGRLDVVEPKVTALSYAHPGTPTATQWNTTTDLTAESSYAVGDGTVFPIGMYELTAVCTIKILGGAATLTGDVFAYLALDLDESQVGTEFMQSVNLNGTSNKALTFTINVITILFEPDTFKIRASLGTYTDGAGVLWFQRRLLVRRIS